MVKSGIGVSGKLCSYCDKYQVDIEATGTCDITVIDTCQCATTDIFDYSEQPIKIESIEQYLKYKNENKPSKSKRLRNRVKRKR